ncbi:MAG: hypothetical protein EA398_16245 [Deltaproteobacteria bacterium]|nr:MAG: hypothetical protein EA398_16245 [Deltaproteobacteria bacterium]
MDRRVVVALHALESEADRLHRAAESAEEEGGFGWLSFSVRCKQQAVGMRRAAELIRESFHNNEEEVAHV